LPDETPKVSILGRPVGVGALPRGSCIRASRRLADQAR